MSEFEHIDEETIEVTFSCSLPTLRKLLECVNTCHKNWPGGDAEEQEQLFAMKTALFVLLYNTLIKNDLV